MRIEPADSSETARSNLSGRPQPRPADSQFLQIIEKNLAPRQTLKSLAEAADELLARTAELPDSDQGLLHALTEYRYAVFAFVSATDRLTATAVISGSAEAESLADVGAEQLGDAPPEVSVSAVWSEGIAGGDGISSLVDEQDVGRVTEVAGEPLGESLGDR